MLKQKNYNYVYKITNTINNKIYIGCHQTNNLDDGYMGSGIYLRRAYEKHGIENFFKEILGFYSTPKEMFDAEANIVTREFITEDNNYNLAPGGRGGFIFHTTQGRENIRNSILGKVMVKDSSGESLKIDQNDPRWITKELVGVTKNKALVRDQNGKRFLIDMNDPRYISGELVGNTKGLASVKDKDGNCFMVDVNDSRLKNGELVGVTKGITQTEESNRKRSESLKGIKREKRPLVSCVCCKKTVDVANFTKWHKKCFTK